jgi:hypothetical protein
MFVLICSVFYDQLADVGSFDHVVIPGITSILPLGILLFLKSVLSLVTRTFYVFDLACLLVALFLLASCPRETGPGPKSGVPPVLPNMLPI